MITEGADSTHELYMQHRGDSPEVVALVRAALREDSRVQVRVNAIVALASDPRDPQRAIQNRQRDLERGTTPPQVATHSFDVLAKVPLGLNTFSEHTQQLAIIREAPTSACSTCDAVAIVDLATGNRRELALPPSGDRTATGNPNMSLARSYGGTSTRRRAATTSLALRSPKAAAMTFRPSHRDPHPRVGCGARRRGAADVVQPRARVAGDARRRRARVVIDRLAAES
jgi:hypothetical protein